MQCSTCGNPVPEGAAFCPKCGSVSPDQVYASGVSPADPTIHTSYGEASPNPYEGNSSQNPYEGEASQNPYGTFNPYAAPATAPPPPPVRRRRPPTGVIALLIVLVLLIIGAGGLIFLKTASSGQQHSQASSPTPAQQGTASSPTPTLQVTVSPSPATQATATLAVQSPQSLYEQITQRPAALDDPLLRNDTSNWSEGTSADGQTSCAFSGGVYHARAQSKNAYSLCMAQASNFGDLAYQVQMSIVSGEFGGMVFRADGTQSKYYSFFIDRSGNYTLVTSVDNTGTRDYELRKGTSTLIRTNLNQINTLTIIARGTTLYLYINQQYITSASDGSYKSGQIGVFGGDYTQAPADVVFSRVQVWNL